MDSQRDECRPTRDQRKDSDGSPQPPKETPADSVNSPVADIPAATLRSRSVQSDAGQPQGSESNDGKRSADSTVADEASSNKNPGRPRSRSEQDAWSYFLGLTGYLIGILGLYVDFVATLMRISVVVIDILILGAIVSHARRQAGRKLTWLVKLIYASSVAFLLIINTLAFGFPPPSPTPGGGETCVYDVSTGASSHSIPIGPGGSVRGQLQLGEMDINSISVIVGLDRSTANPDIRHPIELNVDIDGDPIPPLQQGDIVDNEFTRFDLPAPIRVGSDELVGIEVINRSSEPIGVYVKQPGPGDRARGFEDGIYVTGHVGREAGYLQPGYALSGCITRPG
jgi:hypothetical protein